MQEIKQEPFTSEEKRLVVELIDNISDAYSRMFFPTIVFDGEKAKESLIRTKKILERLV